MVYVVSLDSEKARDELAQRARIIMKKLLNAVDDAVIQSVEKARKVLVESHDEVYYPTVTVVREAVVQAQALDCLEIKTDKTVLFDKSEETTRYESNMKRLGEAALASHMEVKAEEAPMMKVINNDVSSRRKRGGARRVFSGLATVVVTAVAVVALALVGMRLAGFRTFTVMSGSMEPNYPVGAMIYVKPVDYTELKVGDVISYVADNDKTVVTHRIAEIEVDEKDASVWRFKTKGDANKSADAKLVHYKNVLGTPAIVIPYIGYLAHNIQQPPGIYIALVVGTLLLAWTFLPGTLEERRKTAKKSVM